MEKPVRKRARSPRIRAPRTKETSLERIFRLALEAAHVPFLQNYTDFHVAQPDFYLPQYRTVVEIDGAYWHAKPKQIKRDHQKDAFYRSLGLKVYRFTEAYVKTKANWLVHMLLMTEDAEYRGRHAG